MAKMLSEDGRGSGQFINVARFDLVSIQLVVLCAQRGSLAEAARMAHMSKSTASHRLTTLEECLGHLLFHRNARGLRLTQAGTVFVDRAQLILKEVRGLGYQLARLEKPPLLAEAQHSIVERADLG